MNTTELENVVYGMIKEYVESQPGIIDENFQWAARLLHDVVEWTIKDYAQDNGIEYESVY